MAAKFLEDENRKNAFSTDWLRRIAFDAESRKLWHRFDWLSNEFREVFAFVAMLTERRQCRRANNKMENNEV